MEGLGGPAIICLLALVFVLTFLFVFEHWQKVRLRFCKIVERWRNNERISISCFLALVSVLTFLFVFKHWLDDQMTEQIIAASNLFHPLPNPKNIQETTKIWEKVTKAKQTVACSCKAAQISSFFTLPNNHYFPENNTEICPSYFNFIRQDLKPWEKSGITLEDVEEAKRTASFRAIVINGRLFVEIYRRCFQTRDLFTIWGFLQLLRTYRGLVPDLDLMFNCDDRPVIEKDKYGNTQPPPPPLFHYCGSKHTFDISFPDWSFWGWPEVQTPSWNRLMEEIRNGSQQVRWEDRDPTAYWKGNPRVARKRQDLMKCSNTPNWNGRLYNQDWNRENRRGFRDSKLSSQCTHRYKIYIEGIAWSVSLKNILACNSPTLLVIPEFHDFFFRGLVQQHHYWPIRLDNKCEDIMFAVNWGNNHTEEAMEIGKAGSDFILNELKMKYVYDYMLHVLREYAKLLKYKPTVTKKAMEYCSESILCFANDAEKEYMKESIVTGSSPLPPCKLGEAEWYSKAMTDLSKSVAKSMKNVTKVEN